MKIIAILLLCLSLSGCATASKINSIGLGMTREEVVAKMGRPVSTSAIEGTEYMNYSLSETFDDEFYGRYTPYYVCIRNGKVISYGRTGDFNTTKDPTQVIKVIGDIKSEQKVDIKTENKEELVQKLKTLNKLLADGLITQNEFEEQKKKLLDNYTNK
jgi:nitrogen regulatory protein PII-like uncharacterized protein